MANIPTLAEGRIGIRPLRLRDTRDLDAALTENRAWLRQWEATNPSGFTSHDVRGSIRSLQTNARAGLGLPFAIELDGRFVGQLNVSGITYGSLGSATIGYWVTRAAAGHDATPTAVALATDYCFRVLGLHRMEVCIRPENAPSLRVVEKLGFRYEGLRRRYIHINGMWRDHFCFALVAEEVPGGVLARWMAGEVPAGQGSIPAEALVEAERALPI
ncbi:GNAT family protein [Frigoribacterium sp. CFBP9039]|uniref:GNAT family N-acetyltransferase n=1 Tax=Frigoribacterium TaxID=96492 RepID=UPI0017800F4E|nr:MULTISPECIES: GNAT family protein [Frigoribacterium]MBD8702897.1 GNAT family N-acetyltransferase [Frigoribacterium sp. CFBP 13712]MCJ0700974.1 GNAT family N-acetyltransferase [Frigoribacterium faeni]MDY0890329.1 GNAT family protein [Frigoribacterium sp. CFBP9030]MDY0944850.1 GNAT family protein [Frigoribacterium sp. CFBP9039]